MLRYYLPGHSEYSFALRKTCLPTRSTTLSIRRTRLSMRSICLLLVVLVVLSVRLFITDSFKT